MDADNELYANFKNLELIIEGPEINTDYSYFIVNKNEDLKELEKGMPLKTLDEEIE